VALSNAEKQANWRRRRKQHIRTLEMELARLKTAPAALQLEWMIVEDHDGPFLSADLGPYQLVVASDHTWCTGEERKGQEEFFSVAEGCAPALVAAMVAAEAAVNRLRVQRAPCKDCA
jgi:hypothetical protein